MPVDHSTICRWVQKSDGDGAGSYTSLIACKSPSCLLGLIEQESARTGLVHFIIMRERSSRFLICKGGQSCRSHRLRKYTKQCYPYKSSGAPPTSLPIMSHLLFLLAKLQRCRVRTRRQPKAKSFHQTSTKTKSWLLVASGISGWQHWLLIFHEDTANNNHMHQSLRTERTRQRPSKTPDMVAGLRFLQRQQV